LVPASSTTVENANIFNVNAEAVSNNNLDWSNDVTAIYRHGSNTDIKSNIDEIWKTGVPEWKDFRKYNEDTSIVQDEGVVWRSNIANNLNQRPTLNLDKWDMVSAPTIKVYVGDLDTIVIPWGHVQIIQDTEFSDCTNDAFELLFDGQEFEVVASHPGTGKINGGVGHNANGAYITNSTEFIGGYKGKQVNGVLVVDNEVTSLVNVSSSILQEKTSIGEMTYRGRRSTSISTQSSHLGGYRSSDVAISFIDDFDDDNYRTQMSAGSFENVVAVIPGSDKLVNTFDVRFWNGSSQASESRACEYIISGRYA
jgi:hypothetical protein